MSDPNTTISPQAARKSGPYRSIGDIHADVRAVRAKKAAARPVRAIVDDLLTKCVGLAILFWAYRHFDHAILKGDTLYIGIVVAVAALGFSCLIPTQTRTLLAFAGERLPMLRAKGGES